MYINKEKNITKLYFYIKNFQLEKGVDHQLLGTHLVPVAVPQAAALEEEEDEENREYEVEEEEVLLLKEEQWKRHLR